MSMGGFDAGILQDFLTESGELLDQLEGDLVTLEHGPDDPEMLNQVFRALHTIKGSASFLGLTNLVSIAHAAESALNAARNRVIVVNHAMMDLLLQSVDILKVQFGQIRAGADLSAAPAELVRELSSLGEGRQTVGASSAGALATSVGAPAIAPKAAAGAKGSVGEAGGAEERTLDLGPGKQDLVEFLVADLDESLRRVEAEVGRLSGAGSRAEAAAALVTLGEEFGKAVDFFGCVGMTRLARSLGPGAEAAEHGSAECLTQLLPRLAGVCLVLRDQVTALNRNVVRSGRSKFWCRGLRISPRVERCRAACWRRARTVRRRCVRTACGVVRATAAGRIRPRGRGLRRARIGWRRAGWRATRGPLRGA